MNATTTTAALTVTLLLSAPVLAGCGAESTAPGGGAGGTADSRTLSVRSSDDGCEVSEVEAPAGVLTFEVTNTGSQVTEFYLLDEDGLGVVAEIENIGPDATRRLTVNAPAGAYLTACKPGMVGDGIRAAFTVTESDQAVEIADADLVEQAQAGYAAYVEDQSAQLLARTREFVGLYEAGGRTTRPGRSTRWRAPTGSGSRPSRSPSATSTR